MDKSFQWEKNFLHYTQNQMQNLEWLDIVIKFALFEFWASSILHFKAHILIL